MQYNGSLDDFSVSAGSVTVTGGTVTLPNDQIQAIEIEDEPGVANVLNNSAIFLGTSNLVLISRSITAPAAGSIVAICFRQGSN